MTPDGVHRLEHREQAVDVLPVVVERDVDRLAGRLPGREVDDTVDLVVAQGALDGSAVEHRRLDDRHARHQPLLEPGGEVVEDDHLATARQQFLDDVGADVAGAAGDQPAAHAKTSPVIRSYASTYFARVCSTT